MPSCIWLECGPRDVRQTTLGVHALLLSIACRYVTARRSRNQMPDHGPDMDEWVTLAMLCSCRESSTQTPNTSAALGARKPDAGVSLASTPDHHGAAVYIL